MIAATVREELQPLLEHGSNRKTCGYEERFFLGISEELYGYLLMFLAATTIGTSSFIVHLLSSPLIDVDVSPIFIALTRGICLLTCSTVGTLLFVDYGSYCNSMSSKTWQLLIARGLLGALGLICLMKTLSILPFGDAATLFFLNPIFTMIFTSILLQELVSPIEIMAAVASFIGAALVATGGATPAAEVAASSSNGLKSHASGIVFGLLAAAFAAMAFTVIRKMHSRIHFLFSAFSLGAATLLYATVVLRQSILSVVADLAARPLAATLVCAQALLAFIGQCFLSESLQHCRGIGTIIRNVEVVFAYVLGIVFFGEIPALPSIVGATMILGSVITIAARRARPSSALPVEPFSQPDRQL